MNVRDIEDIIERFGPAGADVINEETEVVVGLLSDSKLTPGHDHGSIQSIVFNGEVLVILV